MKKLAEFATLVLLGLILGSAAHAADGAVGGIEVPCKTKTGQRIVYKTTLTVTDEETAQTLVFDYQVRPDRVDGRVSHSGGAYPFTFRLSRSFAFETIIPDDPNLVREDGKYGLEHVYGPLFKQAIAFCGQRWMPGETRHIELPFPRVDADVSATLLRVGRLYGRRAAQFEIAVTGRMPYPGRKTGEMAGSGTAWADVETGVTLESVMQSQALIYGHEKAPVLSLEVKEERRLDQQMSSF
jgi:hypothetical protein